MSKRKPAVLKAKDKDEELASKKKIKVEEQPHNIEGLQQLANKFRIQCVEMTKESKSGHPTSCASMADLMTVLFFDPSGMHYLPKNPKSFVSDRFVLSKGHAAPVLYCCWAENGYLEESELMNLRKVNSLLEGHPRPHLPFIDVATGSLGCGLGVTFGMAYVSKYMDKIDNRFYCLIGDGECAEGSIWESASLSSYYKLDNIIAICDINRLGQSQETQLQHDMATYEARFQSFGWHTITIDGHDFQQIIDAFYKARNLKDKPIIILAKTFKGKGIDSLEDQLGWHGMPYYNDKWIDQAILKLKLPENKFVPVPPLMDEWPDDLEYKFNVGVLDYKKGDKLTTRKAYGNALRRLGKIDKQKKMVVLDCDVKASTFSIYFKEMFPEQYIECFIAEQNMINAAEGIACRRRIPFCSTFAAFLTRAYDMIRMGGISFSNIKICGSHCGISIGQDGPSQMALEDICMMRSIPESTIFYPTDAVACERAVELSINKKGICYIRCSRPDTEIIYDNDEKFEIGRCKLIRQTKEDKLLLIAGGITLYESIKAYNMLEAEGIKVRLIDIFCIKPIDGYEIIRCAKECKLVLTVEDHYQVGGIYDAVCCVLASETGVRTYGVAVDKVPRSGNPDELLEMFGLSANRIVDKVKQILREN